MSEQFASFDVASGYSETVRLNYPGYMVIDVMAENWGTGGVTLERSAPYKEQFSVVQDEDGDVNFTSNGARLIPGLGDYRVNCSGYSSMSGVEALVYSFRQR
jgi:hypothetical protein